MSLVTDLYDQIIITVSPNEDWENENGAFVQMIIEMTLNRLGAPKPEPYSPPNWHTVHIGDGIFVETDNPELNCEVGQWK